MRGIRMMKLPTFPDQDCPNVNALIHLEDMLSIPGWWYTYPSEKYESQMGLLFPIYGKIKFMFQTTNQIQISYFFPYHAPKQRMCHNS